MEKQHQRPAKIQALVFSLFLSSATGLHAAPLLVSVDFERDIGPHPFSGVESFAAAANSLYGEANIWNILTLTAPSTVDPSFNSLVNAGGAPSGVNLAITGTVSGVDKLLGTDLTGDYLLFDDGATSSTINFELSGLTPSTEYAFYTYTSAWSSNGYDITVDTDGDTSLADETPMTVTNVADGYFSSVTADSSGQIIGRLDPNGTFPSHWAGFQLAQVAVPEPGSAFLVLVSGMAAVVRRRRRTFPVR